MTRAALPHVHPTAVISDEAVLAPDVRVGPFAVIDGPVTLGPGCVVGPHAHLLGRVTMGADNHVHAGAVLGGAPQHLGYKGEPTSVEIGDGNIFREHVTISRGMPAGTGPATGATKIGSRNLFMANTHAGHDCVIGDDAVFANGALLAGHVTVGDRAFVSGNSAVHQFVRIGRLAFLSGMSAATMDVPPFCIVAERNEARGLNLVGLKRAGFAPPERTALRRAYHILYLTRPALPLSAALARVEAELGAFAAIRELLAFARESKRGICRARGHADGSGADGGHEAAA